jgi:hypothetical protein
LRLVERGRKGDLGRPTSIVIADEIVPDMSEDEHE